MEFPCQQWNITLSRKNIIKPIGAEFQRARVIISRIQDGTVTR